MEQSKGQPLRAAMLFSLLAESIKRHAIKLTGASFWRDLKEPEDLG